MLGFRVGLAVRVVSWRYYTTTVGLLLLLRPQTWGDCDF